MRYVFASVSLAALATTAFAQAPVVVPNYAEETKSAGINSIYQGDWQYMVGGGVASFDCNGDRFPDMMLAGGTLPAKFYLNTAKQGGALSFKEAKSGLEMDSVTGAYPLDVDSDGVMDLVVLRVGENAVMRGLGNCQFENANTAWGFDGGDAWSTSFSATWEKGATWPTLAVGNYIDRAQETSPWGSCTDNWLHRPDGQKFAAPTALKPSYCALSMLFTDWNRSGTPSLRVSNDREYYEGGQEQLWKMEPSMPPRLYTEAEGWKKLKIWGMGIASFDVNSDGFPDYYLTSMADSKLQTIKDMPTDGKMMSEFKDVAYVKGVTAHRPYTGTDLRPSTGWHAQFEDVNNDGMNDLFVAKGNVDQMPDFAHADPNNLLVQGADGTFVEMGDKAGVASIANTRGGSLVDFNLDGLMDLVTVNRRETAQVWRNTTKDAGKFLMLELNQDGPNRDAIGSWIEVKQGEKTSRREITVGGGHASGQTGFWHFGLGAENEAEVRVIWANGEVGEWQTLKADQFYRLESGKAPAHVTN